MGSVPIGFDAIFTKLLELFLSIAAWFSSSRDALPHSVISSSHFLWGIPLLNLSVAVHSTYVSEQSQCPAYTFLHDVLFRFIRLYILIVIINSRFLERSQKRSRGNQLIHRRLNITKWTGSNQNPESQRGRRLWWMLFGVETGGMYGEEDESG